MKRIPLLLLAMLAAAPAMAQLKPAPPPTQTRPVSLPPPSRPASDASGQAADNARLRERLERPALGDRPAAKPTAKPAAKPSPTAAVPVYDHDGRRLNGMRPAGPGRVMDTRTGRYHDTVPSGDGVRIVR